MGKRGPPPKPLALKDLAGTRRSDREAPNVPEPEPGVPELPANWGEDVPWGPMAVEEYFYMAPRLKAIGLLTEIDRPSFLLYCDAWGRWIYYRRRIGREGSLTRNPSTGALTRHPSTILAAQALTDLKRFLSLFGLSPADRTKVSATKTGAEKKNPFAKLGAG
jgi:P27 family predicted phage terminase small subunit